MYKDKAYVCNRCRKIITFSHEEAGKTMPCPFCEAPVTLPTKGALPAVGRRATKRVWPGVLLALAVLGGTAAWLAIGSNAKKATQSIPVLSELIEGGVTVAPAAASIRGAHLSVAVTEVSFGRPDIYDAALNKTEPTKTPVCCVKLAVTNTGKEPAAFSSWREIENTADLAKIRLAEAAGPTNSLVSFGPSCAPAGLQPSANIAPGETAYDMLFFLCRAKPAADLEFTLPCGNLGGRGLLRFRIPREMVQ